MNTGDLISVVMPCYNGAARLRAAVDSVFAQTYSAVELVVVNDGSTDDSAAVLDELAARHPRLHAVHQPNRGPGAARNRGLAEASGKYVAFLDADDSWHPECLARLHETLSAAPDAVLSYCGWQNLGVPEHRGKPFVPPDYETPDKIEVLLRGCRWPIHAALTQKAAIDAIGGFDEQLTSSMDYDLWLRLGTAGRVVRTPHVLAYYHHHEGAQITKNRLRIALNHFGIQQRFIRDHPEIRARLGPARVRAILCDELNHRAYASFWQRDLVTAHALFRRMLLGRYYRVRDLKYALPALLPFPLYTALVRRLEG